MRSIRLCFTAAVIAALFIAACSTMPDPTPSAQAEKKERRLAPPDSNCKFESFCQVIVPNDEPASAARR